MGRTVYTDVLVRGYQNVGYEELQDNARLDVAGGDSGIAPFKIGVGGLTTVPRPGAIENVGDDIFWTDSYGVRHSLLKADSLVENSLSLLMYGKASLMRKEGFLGASAGWYRIASTKASIGANEAIFRVYEKSYDCIFTIKACLSNNKTPTLTVDALSGLNEAGITKVRLVYTTGTVDGYYAYLEVYKAGTSSLYAVVESVEPHGWDIVPPVIPGGVPSGFTTKEVELVEGADFNGTAAKVVSTAVNSGTYYITGVQEPSGVHSFDYDVYFNASDGSLHSNAINSGSGTFTGSLGVASTVTLSVLGAGVVHSSASGVLSSSKVALASEVSGTLPVANGGTGATTLTANRLLVGNGTSAIGVVGTGTANYVLIGNGNAVPTWVEYAPKATYATSAGSATTATNVSGGTVSCTTLTASGSVTLSTLGAGVVHSSSSGVLSSGKVALDSEVSGVLPVVNGGTGRSSITAGALVYGNGTGVASILGIGTNNYVLVSNGSAPTWVEKAPNATNAEKVGITSSTAKLHVLGVATNASGNSTIYKDQSVTIEGGTITATTFSGSLSGGTISGTNLTATGTVTLGTSSGVAHLTSGVLSTGNVALGSEVSGVLPVANGGTGISSYSKGNILYATANTTLAALPIGTADYVLKVSSDGIPAWAEFAPKATYATSAGSATTATNADNLSVNASTSKLYVVGTTATTTNGYVTIARDASVYVQGGTVGATTFSGSLSGGTISGTTLTASSTVTFSGLGTVAGVVHNNASGVLSSGLVSLTADVSGKLPVANGGTGASSLTKYAVLLGNGTGVVSTTAVGTNNYVLIGKGSSAFPEWAEKAPKATDADNASNVGVASTTAKLYVTGVLTSASGNSAVYKDQSVTVEGGTVTATTFSGSLSGGTISGTTLTVSSTATFSGLGTGVAKLTDGVLSAGNVDLATSEVTGTLVVTKGGTGVATVAKGDLLYGSASNTWNKLAIGGTSYAGRVLYNTGTLPEWKTLSDAGIATKDHNHDGTYLKLAGGESVAGIVTFTSGLTVSGGTTTLGTLTNALYGDSGVIKASTTTATELGYVHGVTSAIQTQLDNKVTRYRVYNRDTNTTWNGTIPLWILSLKNGYPAYTDTEFESGSNSVSKYNNTSGSTGVVVERVAASGETALDSLGCGNNSGYVIKVTLKGNSSPNYGGFVQSVTSAANKIKVQIFRALLPEGYYFVTASNTLGDGYKDVFLTNPNGTGKWEWYARTCYCGVGTSFSTGGHVSVTRVSDSYPAPTTSAPIVFYIAECNNYDITRGSYGALRARYADSSTSVTATSDTTNTLYLAGIKSGDTSTLRYDTSITAAGGTLTANVGIFTSVKVGGGVLLKYADSMLNIRNNADSDWASVKVGNLTVEGTITYINTQDLNVADNIITLNSDVTGTPSENGGIEIKRGTSTNASLIWDESNDVWKCGLVGSESIIVTAANYTDYVKNGSLYLQANGSGVATFTANQSGNTTLNIGTGSSNGTISVGGSDVAVKGLGSNAYTSTAYLPLTGGTLSGITTFQKGITIDVTQGTWVSGMTQTGCISFEKTDSSNYFPYIRGLSNTNNVWNWGGYQNQIGVYGYFAGRTDNSYDWRTYWDLTTGNLYHSKGLQVSGVATFSSNVGVTSALTVGTTLSVTGGTTLTGNLTANGISTIADLYATKLTLPSATLIATPAQGRIENDGVYLYYTDDAQVRHKLGYSEAQESDSTALWEELEGLNHRAMGERIEGTLLATVGWYRIATLQNRSSANGVFRVSDQTGGNEVLFTASVGVGSYGSLTQLGCSGATNISKARIAYSGAYAFLEVYNNTATAKVISVEAVAQVGWKLTSGIKGGAPTVYNVVELTFHSNAVVANYFYGDGSNLTNISSGSFSGILGVTHGGTGVGTIAKGELLYGSAANTLSRLGIGSTGTILYSNGSVPSWSTPNDAGIVIKAGSTWTGVMTALGSQYTDSRSGALNMNNSNIYGVNSVIFADKCDNAAEGLQWYRGTDTVDSVWVKDGVMYITPNRALGITSETSYTFLTTGNWSDTITMTSIGMATWAQAANKPTYTLDEVSDGTTRKLADYINKDGSVAFLDAWGRWDSNRRGVYRDLVNWTSGSSSSFTGAIKIKVGAYSSTMRVIRITLYNYKADNSSGEIIVSGYTYTTNNQWTKTTVFKSTNNLPSVKLTCDGSNFYIILGAVDTAWSYNVSLAVDEMANYTVGSTERTAWSAELITTEPTWTNSVTPSVNVGFNADTVDGAHVGVNSGNIAVLGSGGVFATSVLPVVTVAKGGFGTSSLLEGVVIGITGSGYTSKTATGSTVQYLAWNGTGYGFTTIASSDLPAINTLPSGSTDAGYVLVVGSANTYAPTWTEYAPKATDATNASNLSVVKDVTTKLYVLGVSTATATAGNKSVVADTSVYVQGGTVGASTFIGDLNGNALSADSATDATNASKLSVSTVTSKIYLLGVTTASSSAGNKAVYADASVYVQGGTVGATTFSGDLSGNASTASAWKNGRTITLTGGVTGTSASWTGSGNLTIDTTLSSHQHAVGDITGILPIANGGTGSSSATAYRVLAVNSGASAYTTLGVGTSNYVLVGNGASSLPTWVEKAPKATDADNASNVGVIGIVTTGTESSTVYYLTGVETFGTAGTSANRPLKSTKLVTWTGAGALSAVSMTVTGLSSGVVRSTSGALGVGSVNLESEVTGTLPVADGGTGATTLTANRLLVGNGTSAISVLGVATSGYVLMGNSSNVPAFVPKDSSGFSLGVGTSATTATTKQWYRIAQSGAGISRCFGLFRLYDATSGNHNIICFTAGISYSNADSTNVVQISNNSYSNSITKARIVYHATYTSNYAYLEVYKNNNTTAFAIYVRMVEGMGWSLVAPSTVGSVPSGYTSKEFAFTRNATSTPNLTLTGLGTVAGILHKDGDGIVSSSLVSLTADITGTLGVGNGGIGTTTLTSGRLLMGNGANAISEVAAPESGKYLKWNGTGYVWDTPSTGGGSVDHLGDIGDVTITSAAKGNLIWYNGTGWANVAGPSTSGYVLAETVTSGAVTALTWVNPNLVGVATRATNNSTKNYLIGIQTYSSAGNRSAYVSYGGYQYFQGNGVFCTKSLIVSDYSTTLGVVYNNTTGIVTTLTGGTAGQVLRVDSDGTGLEWATISSGSTTLSGLTDTSISSPGAYALLYYDSTSSTWKNLTAPSTNNTYLKYVTGTGLTWATVSGGGGGATQLSELDDVGLGTAVLKGDILWFGGEKWNNFAGISSNSTYILSQTKTSSGGVTMAWTQIAPQASQVRLTGVTTTNTTKYYLTGNSGVNTASTYARSLYTPLATATTSPYFTPAGEVGFNSLKLNGNAGTAGQVLMVNSDASGLEWGTPSGGGSGVHVQHFDWYASSNATVTSEWLDNNYDDISVSVSVGTGTSNLTGTFNLCLPNLSTVSDGARVNIMLYFSTPASPTYNLSFYIKDYNALNTSVIGDLGAIFDRAANTNPIVMFMCVAHTYSGNKKWFVKNITRNWCQNDTLIYSDDNV